MSTIWTDDELRGECCFQERCTLLDESSIRKDTSQEVPGLEKKFDTLGWNFGNERFYQKQNIAVKWMADIEVERDEGNTNH